MKETTKGMTRRSFVKTAGAAAGLAAGSALVGCSSSDAGSSSSAASAADNATSTAGDGLEPIDLTIGYWGGSPCELPMYIAFMKGYWQEAGINPTELLITNSTNELLANDEIDCFECVPTNLQGIYEGLNLKLIDTIHYGCFSGATVFDNGITSCADLKGKPVGMTGIGSVAYLETCSLAYREGVKDPANEIEWKQYSSSLMEQALTDGEVVAICNQDQIIQPILERNPNFTHYYFSCDDFHDTLCCFLGLNSNTMKEKPEAADRLCAAWKMAMDYIQKDVKAATEEALKAGYIGYFDDYQDAVIQLAEDYRFGCYSEDVMRTSLIDRYKQNIEAGLIKDAPSLDDTEALDEFLTKLADNAMEFHGQGN